MNGGGGYRGMLAAAVTCLALLALAELLQAWHALRGDSGAGSLRAQVRPGSICSVLLVNGQMYYGTLVSGPVGFVELSDVYYVRSVTPPDGTAQNQVVSRRKVDWHGPEWMAIPLDKVQFIEQVGADSQLAKLIAQDRGGQPAQ